MIHEVIKSQIQFSDWAHVCTRTHTHTHTHTNSISRLWHFRLIFLIKWYLVVHFPHKQANLIFVLSLHIEQFRIIVCRLITFITGTIQCIGKFVLGIQFQFHKVKLSILKREYMSFLVSYYSQGKFPIILWLSVDSG